VLELFADALRNPTLALAATGALLITLVSRLALPEKVRKDRRASIYWIDRVSVPLVIAAYVSALAHIENCESIDLLFKAGAAASIVALITLVAHLGTYRFSAVRDSWATFNLSNFFIFRLSVAVALIALAAYSENTKTDQAKYIAAGVKLFLLEGGDSVPAPKSLRMFSGQNKSFRAETLECKSRSVQWTLDPLIGDLVRGGGQSATYHAPQRITERATTDLTVTSPIHKDSQTLILELQPTPDGIKRISIPDKNNPDTLFDIVVLSKADAWKFGDSKNVGPIVDPNSETVDACAIVNRISKEGLFNNYQAIVAVGTASRKGSDEEERVRAEKRANKLAGCVNGAISNNTLKRIPTIHVLNLGRYQSDLSLPDSPEERRAILIGVMSGKRNASTVMRDFSLQTLTTFSDDSLLSDLSTKYLALPVRAWVQ
jgi:hypothetical protein